MVVVKSYTVLLKSAEVESMKFCDECGAENGDSARFCSKCGSELRAAESDDVVSCPNCGAQNTANSDFCVMCGTALIEPPPTECQSCGATLVEGAKFCGMCGAAIGATKAKNESAKKRTAGRLGAFEAKVNAFEAKHSIIVNALIVAFALVFILVSLLMPVKMSISLLGDFGSSDGSSSALSSVEVDNIEIKQSIWKFFGAIGYIGLDMEDEDDEDKIKDIIEQYIEAIDDAEKEYKEWLKTHEYATMSKCKEQQIQIIGEKLSDVNMLALTLAITTSDVMNTYINESLSASQRVDIEEQMEDVLEYRYSAALIAAVEGMLTSITALALAAVSAAFAAVAVYGMISKRTRASIFVMLFVCLAVCGVGMLLQAVSPALIMSGGIFVSAIVAACAYLVLGAVQALASGGKLIVVIKRAVVAAVCLVAFFILSGNIFSMATTAKASEKVTFELSAPICQLFDRLMYGVLVKEHFGYDIVYANASVASLVVSLILCAAILALMYGSLVLSLRALRQPDVRVTSAWIIIMSTVLLLLVAIVPAILSGVTKLSATVENGEIEIMCKIQARAQVYVSMGLTLAAFVLAKLFEPQKKASGAVAG